MHFISASLIYLVIILESQQISVTILKMVFRILRMSYSICDLAFKTL